jgi:hypothetical protein
MMADTLIMESRFGSWRKITCTIANGESLSGAVDLDELVPVRIDMPATWTAASLTFQVSDDNSTFRNLYDATVEVRATSAAASVAIALDPILFAATRYIKVRSGTSGTPVSQGGARTVTIIARPLL